MNIRISMVARGANDGVRFSARRASCRSAGMMVSLLTAAGVSFSLAPRAAATITPFGINVVDAGGIPGGSLGAPITWTGGAAYNPPAGADTPPSEYSMPRSMFFDSYLALDPIGPSTPAKDINPVVGHTANGPSGIIFPTATPGTPFSASSLSGVWFNSGAGGGFVTSGLGPGGVQRMFIAQITLRPGSSVPMTDGVMVNIKDSGTANPDGALGVLKFGLSNAANPGGQWGQAYYLDWVATLVDGVNTTFNGGVSYAIYVVAVPGPGAAAAMVGAGACALRRRERRLSDALP